MTNKPKRKDRTPVVMLALVGSLAVYALFITAQDAMLNRQTSILPSVGFTGTSAGDRPDQPIQLGFENPGVHVLVRMECPDGVPGCLGVTDIFMHYETRATFAGFPSRSIYRPSDLQGLVNISTEADALKYARMWTDWGLSVLWGEQNLSFEVMTPEDRRHIAGYGAPTRFSQDSAPTAGHVLPPGFGGLVSEHVFLQSGFTRPVVKAASEGFTIERWLFLPAFDNRWYGGDVALVRETISRDGGYQRQILKRSSAPEVPDGGWTYTWPMD